MPNTYTQLYIQFVFAVKGRENLIHSSWKNDLYKYITGIVQNNKSKLITINGMEDHIHIFIGYKPSVPIPDLVKDIKVASTLWINEKKLSKQKFAWQEGYGAFSYSHSQIDAVYKYIRDQEIHHLKKTFKQEYIDFLISFKIEYNDKYLFDFAADEIKSSTPTELPGSLNLNPINI
ncbi:MAG: IS200/IS605 family transposase [Bacteroidota bacterium]|nr:IS200/IS605 family transposase [Bacteroidota bacterium]